MISAIMMGTPTRPMQKAAASAGFYEPEYMRKQKYAKLQILTIDELLDGKAVSGRTLLQLKQLEHSFWQLNE